MAHYLKKSPPKSAAAAVSRPAPNSALARASMLMQRRSAPVGNDTARPRSTIPAKAPPPTTRPAIDEDEDEEPTEHTSISLSLNESEMGLSRETDSHASTTSASKQPQQQQQQQQQEGEYATFLDSLRARVRKARAEAEATDIAKSLSEPAVVETVSAFESTFGTSSILAKSSPAIATTATTTSAAVTTAQPPLAEVPAPQSQHDQQPAEPTAVAPAAPIPQPLPPAVQEEASPVMSRAPSLMESISEMLSELDEQISESIASAHSSAGSRSSNAPSSSHQSATSRSASNKSSTASSSSSGHQTTSLHADDTLEYEDDFASADHATAEPLPPPKVTAAQTPMTQSDISPESKRSHRKRRTKRYRRPLTPVSELSSSSSAATSSAPSSAQSTCSCQKTKRTSRSKRAQLPPPLFDAAATAFAASQHFETAALQSFERVLGVVVEDAAVRELLQSQLHLVSSFLASSREMYTMLATSTQRRHYTTLGETRKYMAQHRPAVSTLQEALDSVQMNEGV